MSLSSILRTECFARDNWRCVNCGNRGGLHPHHITHKSAGGLDVLENLVTVCWLCHAQHHSGLLDIWFENGVLKFGKMRY